SHAGEGGTSGKLPGVLRGIPHVRGRADRQAECQEVSGVRNIDQSDVQATLRDMWETRPARRADDRKVAGVAAAIARRYDLDPTLVRIGFVVAAFSGIGAALYIAGWFALPSETGPSGVPRSRQGLAI